MTKKLAQKLSSEKSKLQARDLARFMDFVSAKRRQSTDWRKWSATTNREDEERYAEQLAGHVCKLLEIEVSKKATGFEFADLVYQKMLDPNMKFLPHFQSVINFLLFIEEKKSISLDWLKWPTGTTPLQYDEEQGVVIIDSGDDSSEIQIQLSPHQGVIMGLLVRAKGAIVSTNDIGLALYGEDKWYSGEIETSTVERHVGRLRESLGEKAEGGYIRTKKGQGWYLNATGNNEWKRAEALARPVEVALGTSHYDKITCTGFNFAVMVYNEIAEKPLEIY